jgi:hypothetical protein
MLFFPSSSIHLASLSAPRVGAVSLRVGVRAWDLAITVNYEPLFLIPVG